MEVTTKRAKKTAKEAMTDAQAVEQTEQDPAKEPEATGEKADQDGFKGFQCINIYI